MALLTAVACTVYAAALVLQQGHRALGLSFGAMATPGRVLMAGRALRAALSVPFLVVTWAELRRGRLRAAGLAGATAALLVLLLSGLDGGPLAAVWILTPLLVVAVGLALGAAASALTAIAVIATFALAFAVATDEVAVRLGMSGAHSWAATFVATVVTAAVVGAVAGGRLRRASAAQREARERLRTATGDLRAVESMLDHAMRVETVGDMAGLVAHQLRNHLQVVLGDVALANDDEPAAREARYRRIGDEIGRASRILQQLLELAHPEAGETTRVDLMSVLTEFADTARRLLPSRIAFETRLEATGFWVELDPRGLEHALLNLVINALQAIEGAGRVTMALERRGDVARIEIRDDGVGIAPDDLDRVFEPYFTTKPPGRGTGLGLAAVQRFVGASGGKLGVDSELGVGSAFWIDLPLVATDVSAAG